MSRIFEKVISAVPVKTAAEHYGLHPNRAGMVSCLFHNDRTPSLKLNDRYYYCFGCGATGDVVDLTSKLYGLQPYEAACKLATDFGVSSEKSVGEYTGRPDFHSQADRCRRVLERYLDLLYQWKTRYLPCYEKAILEREEKERHQQKLLHERHEKDAR